MADIPANSSSFYIQTADRYIIGDAHDAFVGTFHLQLVASEDFEGSVTIQAQSRQAIAAMNGAPFLDWNYLNTYVNGAVGDQTYISTPITDTSMILIPATGCRIGLNCTSYTAGKLTVYMTPLAGAAA